MARRVIVYTTPLCEPCERLAAYLTALGVAFEQKDLLMDAEAAALLEGKNIHSAPALQVDGAFYSGGQLAPDRLDALLGL